MIVVGCDRGSEPSNIQSSDSSKSSQKFEFEYRPSAKPATDQNRHPITCGRFQDVGAEAGLGFVYQNGADSRVLMVESIGAGCGWIDFDRDGKWELYFPQGGNPTTSDRPSDALFRQVDTSAFVDVTRAARIDEREYSQGVAVGDFNNDGFDDLFVTNIQGVPDALFENLGDGTFQNVTNQAGTSDLHWSTSAAWGDLDRDGDLDIYVCNYVDYDVYAPIPCLKDGKPATCHPRNIPPVPDQCYENLGDGRFKQVTREAGLYGPSNRALGLVIADFNNDGWPDIFVANDTTANFLFLNQQRFKFIESAFQLGVAFDARGAAHASMGAAVGDYDQDGFLDLYITGFSGEYNTLYRNQGEHGFHDMTVQTGADKFTVPKLGWGVVMADFNQDGKPDLLTGNGHIGRDVAEGEGYEMKAQLLSFDGTSWHDCTSEAGPYFERKLLARGVATADYDDDGDLDVAVVHQNSPAALLRNDSPTGRWLKLRFTGRDSNRRGVGVRATLKCGNQQLVQEIAGGTSFASSMQPVLIFGLNESNDLADVDVRWPSGRTQKLEGIGLNQSLVLVEPHSDRDLEGAPK